MNGNVVMNPITTVRTIALGTVLLGEVTSSARWRQASSPLYPKALVTRLIMKHTPSGQPVEFRKVSHTNASGALLDGRTMKSTKATRNTEILIATSRVCQSKAYECVQIDGNLHPKPCVQGTLGRTRLLYNIANKPKAS